MPDQPSLPDQITATAHVMQFEPGLYCIGHAPGATPADPASGLPGVRVSPAPGHSPGQVLLCGFNPDGWLARADEAVLVRVVGGTARVLVTIYQAAVGLTEAPKLQVTQLSAPPNAAPAPAGPPPDLVAHIYGQGDVGGRMGDWIGERGSQRWMEGFAIQPVDGLEPGQIEYQAVLGRGWMSPPSEGGAFCGSRGMSLPILGLNVRLTGVAADTHELELWASFVDGTAAGPVAGGVACMADSLAALEAFRLVLTRRKRPRKKRVAPG